MCFPWLPPTNFRSPVMLFSMNIISPSTCYKLHLIPPFTYRSIVLTIIPPILPIFPRPPLLPLLTFPCHLSYLHLHLLLYHPHLSMYGVPNPTSNTLPSPTSSTLITPISPTPLPHTTSHTHPPIRKSTRTHNPPSHLKDFICNQVTSHWCNIVSYSAFSSHSSILSAPHTWHETYYLSRSCH